MKKMEKLVLTAMMVALAFVISIVMKEIPILKMPNGGSVSLAMLPIFILAYMLGPVYGVIGGFAYGIVNFFFDGYAFHWASLVFDYFVAFSCLGLCGFFKKWVFRGNAWYHYGFFILGMVLTSTIRFFSHTLSGYIAYQPITFAESCAYNAPYVYASLALCIVAGVLIYPTIQQFIRKKEGITEVECEKNNVQ